MKLVALALLLAAMAGPLVAAPPTTKPAKREAIAAKSSDGRIDDIDFKGLNTRQAMEAIQEKSGVTVTVDWQALEKEKIAPQIHRGRLMDVTARQAVLFILGDLPPDAPIATRFSETAIIISSKQAAPDTVEPRVYNVARLLDHMAREISRGQRNIDADALREQTTDHLVKTILNNIAPDTWRDNGGTTGTLSLTGTRLTISQTRTVHSQIDALLKDLEKPKPR